MKKKIPPDKQTEELNRARFEFLSRNTAENEKAKQLFEQDERLFMEYASTKKIPAAVNSVWRWLDYTMEIEYKRLTAQTIFGVDNSLTYEELKPKVMGRYCRDAREIFTELMNERPAVHLLLGVDLTRNKGVILAEVEALIVEYQRKLGVHELPEHRFKWLPLLDELLSIWDAWAGYGQRRCFHLITSKLKIPESTVKARWRVAYRLIHGEEYTKEVAAKSADELCSRCGDQGKCYRQIKGVMDFFPCAAYLKLTGKSYTRETLIENFEAVAEQYASDE